MANVNVTYHDRVEYEMEHSVFGTLIIEEPLGWDTSDEKEYARVTDNGYDGIFTKFSNKLTFVGDGAEFARLIYKTYGPNTDFILKKRERHPLTNRWELAYLGYLDLMTYEYQEGQVDLKFNTSGIAEIIKARESEKIEVERLDTFEGDVLPELSTISINQQGRRIFLQTRYQPSEFNSEVQVMVETEAGNTRSQNIAFPMEVATNQHQDIAQSPYFQAESSETVGDIGGVFFLNVDRDRVFNFNINGNLDVWFAEYRHVQWCRYKICLTVYENGTNFNLKQRYVLSELRSENPSEADNPDNSFLVLPSDVDYPYPSFTKNLSFSYVNPNFEVKAGESVALEIYLKSDMYDQITGASRVKTFTKNVTLDFKIEENSYFKPTVTKGILAKELGDRLVNIITNRSDAFYSEALGRTDIGYAQDGVKTGALNAFSHGLWIRGFDKLPVADENKYKAFTTSFKDYIQHHQAVWNLSIGIEKIGFKERIRMEEKGFFYNRNVTIHCGTYYSASKTWDYPRVSKLKRSVATDYFYSSLELGYEKGSENEEAMGLDEYNTKSTFNTAFSKAKNVYEMVSRYIAGSYPAEFIRRKQKEDFPTTDHQNDKEVFVYDLKRGLGGVYDERKYADDFENAPTGVFSPETATNLRLSPFNILLRHGWNIAAGLKDILKYVKYNSSEGNSKLVTKLIGGNAYAENGNIIVSELQTPRYEPEWIEFEFECDYLMIKQIEGSQVILGKTIPNFYGLVQFRNDEGVLEKGFLFNLKPSGTGKWKILKANI